MATKSYPWLKPAIWGALAGIIGITVLGFWQFGWVLGSKADQMAQDRANVAVAEALAPVCAAKFYAQPDAPAKLGDLKKLTSDYEQRNFVEKRRLGSGSRFGRADLPAGFGMHQEDSGRKFRIEGVTFAANDHNGRQEF
jgi:hypothetical protein